MNLYWDTQNQRLVPTLFNTSAIASMTFILRDTLPVRLYIVAPQNSATTPYAVTDIEATESIAFGAKKLLADADFTISQATWTGTGSGTSKYYAADIVLNTAEMIAAIGSADTVTLRAEFTIVGADNSNRLSTQFDLVINRDVIVGDEGTVAAQYPVIAQYTDDSGAAGVRIVNGAGVTQGLWKNGVPYVYCESTALWHPLIVRVVDGVPTPAFGEGVAQ